MEPIIGIDEEGASLTKSLNASSDARSAMEDKVKATVCKVRIAIAGTAIRQSSETNRKMPAKFILQRNFSVCIKAILTENFQKKGTKNGGVNRNRTDLSDFADRCLTSWLSRLVI